MENHVQGIDRCIFRPMSTDMKPCRAGSNNVGSCSIRQHLVSHRQSTGGCVWYLRLLLFNPAINTIRAVIRVTLPFREVYFDCCALIVVYVNCRSVALF